jgi:predicted transcriptional regulator
MEQDFLAEVIHERSARNPRFPALVRAAEERRELLLALARDREASGLTQSQVARLESAGVDTKLSTVEKLAAVLGKRIEWRISDAPAAKQSAS